MRSLIKVFIAIFCITAMFSCTKNRKNNTVDPTPPTSSNITPTPAPVVNYTCDDLKAINNILFITFTYDQKYDLDNDGKVTVQDKLVIENNLLKNGAACVLTLRTCDNLQAVKDQVQTWTDAANLPDNMISAIAYSIIFNESGQRCQNDFDTGSFVGDVNKNGYLDCNDPLYIQKYTVGISIEPFEPLLADVNGNGFVNATDALLDYLAIKVLFNDYMDNLGDCQR